VGGNPFHHNTNLNRFLRAWQQPDTVITHEPWWNPPAKTADIVLPATTTMERNDILAADQQRHYVAMYQVIEPVAQSRNDFDIFVELADRLGFKEAYTEDRDEMAWLRHMYDGALLKARERGFCPPEFDEFWSTGYYEFPHEPAEDKLPLAAFIADPLGSPLKTPSGRIEIFSAAIERYAYPDCPPHPSWLEPFEWLGAATTQRYPLHLLTNQPASRLHSQLDAGTLSRASKAGDRERLFLNTQDAERRGIRTGAVVRVFNDRGAFLASAFLSNDLLEGVTQIATGAWYDPEVPGTPSLDKHGNPNVVTTDKGTSRLAQSSAAQSALVEVELCLDPPPVTAFDPPDIVRR
jgi:biotin/methionine sulfoxide reductase